MFFDSWMPFLGNIETKKKSQHKNDLSFILALQTFVSDALHLRYKIDDIPETCDQRLMMLNLLWRGNCLLVDYHDNLLSLPGTENGQPTIYGRYTSGYTSSLNGKFNKWIKLLLSGEDESDIVSNVSEMQHDDNFDGVAIHESWTRFPFIYYAIYYAEAVSDTLRTIDVSRKHIKRPWLITAEESVVDTIKRYFKNVDDNDEIILSSGVFPVDKINVLPLDTMPQAIQTGTELVEWYENRFRILCGVPGNAAIDKKGENLIEGELSIGRDYAMCQTDKIIEVMQQELDIANKHFGTHMTVRRAVDYDTEKSDIRADGGGRGGDGTLSGRDTN